MPDPQPWRSRLDVIRHRIPARLSGRGRYVTLAAVVLAIAVFAAIGAKTHDPTPSGTAAAVEPSSDERLDDLSRADRSARETPSAPVVPAPTKPPAVATPAAPKTTQAKPATPAAPRTTQAKPVAAAWVSPMPGAEVTSCYGERWGVLHAGIDLALPSGTPVRAAGAGLIQTAGWAFSGYGISVVVDHGSGYLTHYAHLNDTAVSPGQRVATGQVIGYEGSTGDSTGPHLHFEVHAGLWNQIDPAPWMRARGVSFAGC